MFRDIFNRAARFEQAARRERLKSPDRAQKTHAVRFAKEQPGIAIFQVQSAADADGVYNCYQMLSSGVFGSTNIEVLNLIENDTLSSYEPALAYEDRIAAWKMQDAGGAMRWVGVPLVPSVRMARATEPSGAKNNITCNLVANDGETEITSGLGSGITVYFRVNQNDAEYPNAAEPEFADNDYLFVQNISGKWWCVTTLAQHEPCTCS